MPLTVERLAQLRAVNAEVNAIPYSAITRSDEGPDLWKDTPDGGGWYCRDYVLLKSERLRAAGWPESALTVLLCWTEPEGDPPQPQYHAVLAVDCGDETWVLDSRFPDPYYYGLPPAGYRYDRRQIAGTTEFREAFA